LWLTCHCGPLRDIGTKTGGRRGKGNMWKEANGKDAKDSSLTVSSLVVERDSYSATAMPAGSDV
jgi:hypothetical protein